MIHHKTLFKEIFSLSIIVAVLHYVATIYSFYWSVDWFDIMMHFLGGLLMGLIAFWIFFTSEKINYPKDNSLVIFFTVVGFTLIIGLSWELWEIFVGFTDVDLDMGDTILDIIMDVIGAIAAYYYGLLKTNFYKD
ncbi:MAG TPA: hypothetical protein PJ997_02235 [Candidatus Paceibacterota bacterium]|nr:hypothetical protein [Candidatus Paceibacterota bacterium]HMP19132.1 hypothetical protein [Candidatus Paceibacterota bacterium]HMP85159.1 hypothetical protein [Candidatus Paceibacterota bacterium]